MKIYSTYSKTGNYNYYKKPFRKTKGFYILIVLIIAIVGFIYWSIKRTDDAPTPDQQKYTDQNAIPNTAANVIYVSGKIESKSEGADWAEITTGYQIKAKDSVRTEANSKATIELPDKSIIRIAGNSEFKFTEMGMADILIEQIRGTSYNRVNDDSTAIYRIRNKDTELTSLGTAFNVDLSGGNVNLTVVENRVKIKIYKGVDITNMRTIEAGTKAAINSILPLDQMIKTATISSTELASNDWYAWNLSEDMKSNFALGIFSQAVKLAITEPADQESSTDQDTIKIKGLVDPGAKVYLLGKELPNNNGAFETDQKLTSGKNIIEITAEKGNDKSKQVIIVNSTKDTGEIILTGKKIDQNNIELSWEALKVPGIKEFKILQSKTAEPTYPNATYHTQGNSIFKDNWPGLTNGTYFFRICALNNENKCTVYSSDYTVTIGEVKATVGSINLIGKNNNGTIELSWTINEDIVPTGGYRTIISDTSEPIYPGNSSHAIDSNSRNDVWKKLSPGKYYFRICTIENNKCNIYSNVVNTTITETSTGVITLSGLSGPDTINLSWSVTDLDVTAGFKVIVSSTPNVSFPGDSHHLVADGNVHTDSWPKLGSGTTSYFRVCVSTDSGCGVYSNEISIKQ